jgi:fatty-acyl-CoA synthase
VRDRLAAVGSRVVDEIWAATMLSRAGLLPLTSPKELIATAADTRRWGQLGAAPTIAARRYGDRVAIVDELGELTFDEFDERTNRLCNAWLERGLKSGDGVALLARNHRGFYDAAFAALKAGANLILLNTDFAGPQVREVAEREGTALLVHDDEYSDRVQGAEPPLGRWRAWADSGGDDTLESLIASGSSTAPPGADRDAKLTVLTSGTTGTPKGAPRSEPSSLVPIGAFVDKAPFRSGEVTLISSPLFHALGVVHGILAVNLGSTSVLRRHFDAVAALDAIEHYRATAAIVVPTMLRRILDLGPDALAERNLGSLRIVFVAGSQLGGALASRALEAFGPVIYNLYGSTEVSAATIATPDELLAAPDCVGTPPRGTVVRLYDSGGEHIDQPHVTGRIFVGNASQFEGYTGGGTKDVIDGLMSSGDVGHFDEAGRLFIDGRDDDMIVSGGENLFPAEVEELLVTHDGIVEAAVIGVPDDQFGQRLRAFVVRRDGASLDEDAVRDHVRANLARYKVPRDVVFLEELPRNPTGKVLKRELTA